MLKYLKNRRIGIEQPNKTLTKDTDNLKKSYQKALSDTLLLKHAFNAIKDPTAIMGADFKIEWANNAFSKMLDIEPDDICGQTCYKLLRAADEPSDCCLYEDAVKIGCSCPAEILNTRFGDCLLVETCPIFNEVEELTGAALIVHDINELKKSQEELCKFEGRLRTLLDASPDIICFKDGHGRWIEANRACVDLFELGNVDYRGKKNSELADHSPFYKRALLACISSDEKALEKKTFSRSEKVIQTPKGNITYDMIKVPLFEQDGGHQELLVLGRELTCQKLATEALSRSENVFKSIFNTVQDVICLKDGNLKYKLVNPAMERFCGRSDTQIKGKSDEEIFEKNVALQLKTMDEQALAGKVIESEISIQTEDGLKALHITKFPIYGNGQKNVRRVCIIGRDITDRVKLDERLRQAYKMEALGTLAGGIAHDFNNILMSIIGYAELSIFELSEDSKPREYITEVLDAAKRARDLVSQILSFSRQEKRHVRPVNIIEIINDVLRLIQSTIPSTIEVHQQFDIEREIVLADPTEIYQIFMNLCTNAAHAMMRNGGVLSVDLKEAVLDKFFVASHPGAHPGKYLKVTISDTGEGISSHDIKNIFDPYFTTKARGEGTGLGLSVAHGIIQEMGGYIQVYSEISKGTTFIVFLPKMEKFVMGPKNEKSSIAPFGKEHILVVDDEQAIARMITESLKYFGYTITMRTSSIEALEAFKKNYKKFDAVVTDLTMPNMTGDRLAQEIRKIRGDIPIILCTGYSEQVSQELFHLVVNSFQMKPTSGHDLAVCLRGIIDKNSTK